MTTQWLPFGFQDMIQLDVVTSTDPATGLITVAFKVLESRVGDIARFCFVPGTKLLWVASPMDDQGVPIHPASNCDGATRMDRVKVVSDKQSTIDETISGVLADLDMYIRSVKAFQNMVAAEIYTITP